jgi:hypothetical protein
VGFNVAATRQKVGRLLNTSPGPFEIGQGWNQQVFAPTKSCGNANAPGATVCATVIVVSGRESEDRLSQVAAAEAGELSMFIKIAAKIASGSFIGPPFKPFGIATPERGRRLLQTKYEGRHLERWGEDGSDLIREDSVRRKTSTTDQNLRFLHVILTCFRFSRTAARHICSFCC